MVRNWILPVCLSNLTYQPMYTLLKVCSTEFRFRVKWIDYKSGSKGCRLKTSQLMNQQQAKKASMIFIHSLLSTDSEPVPSLFFFPLANRITVLWSQRFKQQFYKCSYIHQWEKKDGQDTEPNRVLLHKAETPTSFSVCKKREITAVYKGSEKHACLH